MSTNSISLLPLISSIFVLGLGLFVFLKNKESKVNTTFFFSSISVTIWLFGTFMMFNSVTDQQAIFWDRFIYMSVVFVPVLMYHFSLAFTQRKNQIVLTTGYVLSFLFFIISRTDYFVADLFRYEWGVHTQARFFHHIFLIFFAVYMAMTLANFLKYYKKKSLTALEKARARYVFVAFFILIIIGSTAYAPAYEIGIFPFSFVSGLIFTAIMSYAILKYRLMDIRLAVSRGLVYGLALTVIISLSSILMFLGGKYFPFIPSSVLAPLVLIICILSFQPLRLFLGRIGSRYFAYAFYNHQQVISNLGRRMTRIIDLRHLSSLIVETLSETMKLERVVILLRNPKNGQYKILKNVGFREENGISLVEDNFLTEHLERTQKPLVYEELDLMARDINHHDEREDVLTLQKNMKRIEANLCLPLVVKNNIIGMIVLGNKASGDPYFEQDIVLLNSLASQASIALENASLYSQVRDLSTNLEKKVEKQLKELKKAYDDLETAYEKLQQLDKAKTEFISIVSHQLRTPLTIMKGYISMILEGSYEKTPKKKMSVLQNVYDSNSRLITLVNDVLNISRLQAGRTELKPEKKQIEDIVGSVVGKLYSTAKEKGVSLIFNKPKKKLPLLNIDETKIENVFLNLIDNAIKYTPSGSIKITITKAKEGAKIKIQDTGEGMNKEELTKLFETFRRGSAGQKLWTEGSGLGLYVAKQFAEMHGGKVWAESKGKGKGSTFYVVLPYA